MLIVERIEHGNATTPGNGFAEPDKFIPVKFIGPSEAVDDLGDRLLVSGWRSLWAS